MGKRAVQVSGKLWQEMCTTGWRIGAPSQDSLECTEGLPEGAVFSGISYKRHSIQGKAMFAAAERPGFPNIVVFIFEHPDWPEIEPGEDAPVISVVHAATAWRKGTS